MVSFVDLLANDAWSEADIVHRTEAELHGHVSKETELILSRKMIGFSLGLVIPTSAEQVELTAYQVAAYLAQQSGIEARADMALLQSAMDYERAIARLLLPVVEVAEDEIERAAAQAIINEISVEALALIMLRSPEPEPEP